MSVVANRNTQQPPLTALGNTGAQSIQLIAAPRVYVKTVDPLTNAPVQSYYTKSAGTTPTGWTDLGIVDGVAKVTYSKKTTDVRTGIDNRFRALYTSEYTAEIDFTLTQVDDYVLGQVSGLTASVITAGSVVNFQLGQEDVTQLALLLVVTNKLDGKEWQFYNPNAYLNFGFDETKNMMVLKCNGVLPSFTANGQTVEGFFSTTIFK